MARTMQEWWAAAKRLGAVWQYRGDPRAPHVVLRSGKHSDGFIDTLQMLSHVEILQEAATALTNKLLQKVGHGDVDWVFGSPMAGIPIATVMAKMLGARNIGFTEKLADNKALACRFNVAPDEWVLLIEEMTTTGGTPQRGIDAIMARNPRAHIVTFVGAFLSRCGTQPPGLRDRELVSVINLLKLGVEFNEWDAEQCLLCAAGSRPIENCKRVWHELLRTMNDPAHPVS